MLAFSGISNANTIALEEEIKNVKSDLEIASLVYETSCLDQWKDDVHILTKGFGATLEEAFTLADRCFEKCLDDTYGPSSNDTPLTTNTWE